MFNKGLLLSGKIKLYNIIRGTVSNVSLSYSPQIDIKAGTTVNITVNANSGYQNPWVTVSKNDGTGNVTVSGSGSSRSFVMPKSDVTITAGASVIPTYSVSLHYSNGSLSASKTTGIKAGENVTIYASENANSFLDSIVVDGIGSTSNKSYTFRMPNRNVSVTGNFTVAGTHRVNVEVVVNKFTDIGTQSVSFNGSNIPIDIGSVNMTLTSGQRYTVEYSTTDSGVVLSNTISSGLKGYWEVLSGGTTDTKTFYAKPGITSGSINFALST